MEYRSFGPSGLKISAIGFGCGNTGILMGNEDDDLREQTVRLALDSGINYFDTAAKYAHGRSEINLGRALKSLGASPYVSTKIVLDETDLRDPRSATLRLFEQSLDRLGMDRVAGLLFHNRVRQLSEPGKRVGGDVLISLEDVLGKNGVAQAFSELRAEGRVQSIGFTVNQGSDAKVNAELIGSEMFDAINVDFSALNPSAKVAVSEEFEIDNYKQVIPLAASFGMGVGAMKVLAAGELVSPSSREVRAQQLVDAAEQLGSHIVDVAIRYALGTPGISCVLLGFSQPRHVEDAVKAAEASPLDDASVALLEEIACN